MKKWKFRREFLTGSLHGMKITMTVTFSSLEDAYAYQGKKKTVEGSMVIDTLIGLDN